MSPKFITHISGPFTPEFIKMLRSQLKHRYGSVVIRGRHSDRKTVLGDKWRKNSQNDIPWRDAEYIAIYRQKI